MVRCYLCDYPTIIEEFKRLDVGVCCMKFDRFQGYWTLQGLSVNGKTEVYVISDRLYKMLEMHFWI